MASKVLHLISSGGLFGAEQVILNLAGRRSDVTMYVGALNNLHNPHLEIIEQAKARGIPHAVFDSKGAFDLSTVKAVRKFLLDNKIDILHTHNYKSDIIGFMALRGTGKKWLATNHLWHSRDTKLKIYEGIDAFVLKFVDQITAVSSEIREDLIKKGFDAGRLQVIDNGIALEPFAQGFDRSQLRQSLGIGPAEVAVVIIGRLEQEKAHDIFLQAAAQLKKGGQALRFLIVGDGPLRSGLEQMAKDLGVREAVVFTGIRKDMPQVYAAADIVVNCSYMEGLPMTILEAMASRKAIIATKVGAIPKVLEHERSGLLVPPGDVQGLSQAISVLAGDAAQRERLGQEAYKDVAARFSDRHMAEQYARIYAKLSPS